MSLFKERKVIWFIPVATLLYFGILIGFWIIAILLHSFIIKPYRITSESMRNTLQIGDCIFVNRLGYMKSTPKQGDIIFFEFPGENSLIPWEKVQYQTTREHWENKSHIAFVHRCIALAEDTVDIIYNRLYINGKVCNESYIREPMKININIPPNVTFPYIVPQGFVFVMGDNRNNSWDSRYWGPVELKFVIGKPLIMYWYSRDRVGNPIPIWKPWTWWRVHSLS